MLVKIEYDTDDSSLGDYEFQRNVFLWRIAESLERANELKLAELELAHPEYAKSHVTPGAKNPRMVTHSVADVQEWNKRYEDNKARIALLRRGV